MSNLIGQINPITLSSRFRLRTFPLSSNLISLSSGIFTRSSDLLGQINMIFLSPRIRLRTSVHFEQYYWLDLFEMLDPFKCSYWLKYLSEKLDPNQAFVLDHIFDQILVLIMISTCEKSVQFQKSYSNEPICTQDFGNNLHLATSPFGSLLESKYCMIVVLVKLCLSVLARIASI